MSERERGAAPFCFFEAKSLLRKLLGSKAVASVLDPGAQSLAEKVFRRMKQRADLKASLVSLPSLGFTRQETVSLSENTARPYSKTT